MRLSNLIGPSSNLAACDANDPEITGVCADSRMTEVGEIFVAIPGTRENGSIYIQDAIAKGARAIVVGEEGPPSSVPESVAVVCAKDPRAALCELAARFYPAQPATIAAVTGTSGKTSTAEFTRKIWDLLGHKAASLGTLGLISDDEKTYGSLTTPDPVTLHKTLDKVAKRNVSHLVMETSSHGIVLNRLDHVRFSCAAFTNLSRDHLDYHADMDDYFAAKTRLFSDLLPARATVVLNADSDRFEVLRSLCFSRGLSVLSYGLEGREIRLVSHEPKAGGQELVLEVFGKTYNLLFPIIGDFQVWNVQAALGLVVAGNEDPTKALGCLEKLSGVPGRLELIGTTRSGGSVFVDYAHKPDALNNVLCGLRPHVATTKGARLHVVFGCGGNRDKGKRPIMGEIATRLADVTIVTDDNPRREDATLIRQEILAGCLKTAACRERGDRRAAIAEAIADLRQGDVLVIAGKGHEEGQIVGDQVLPFSDAAVARDCLR